MSFSFGIEEEYFLVDSGTKAVARKMPDGFFAAAKAALGEQVTGEFLQSQIEIVTAPQTDTAAARQNLHHLAANARRVATAHGLAIMAAGTHPTAVWERSRQSAGERYDSVMDDLQMIGRRNMLCGMHVHVELPDPDDRVDVMTRMLPYLPLFIALSTSSPFWRSQPTGLLGYRLAAYDELPRTGTARTVQDQGGIRRLYRRAGAGRRDAGCQLHLVGDPPVAQTSDAGIARAGCLHARRRRDRDRCALSGAGAAGSHSIRGRTADMNAVTRAIVVENKWRAQRYGVHGTFARIERDGSITVAEMLEHVIAEVDAGRRSARLPRRGAALPDHRRAAAPRPTVSSRSSSSTPTIPRTRLRQVLGLAGRDDGGVTCRLRQRTAYASSAAGSAICTTRPRARASTTPSARSDSSVSVCTASRVRAGSSWLLGRERADQAFQQRADQRRRREPRVLLRQMAGLHRGRDARLRIPPPAPPDMRPAPLHLGIDRLGDHRPGELAAAAAPARRRSRSRRPAPTAGPARPSPALPHGGDLAFRHRRDQRRHQIGLGREIAIDGAGRRSRRARRPARSAPPPCRPRPRAARAAARIAWWRAACLRMTLCACADRAWIE